MPTLSRVSNSVRWSENESSEYIPAKNYDILLSADSKEDRKLLFSIDQKKSGFIKKGLT